MKRVILLSVFLSASTLAGQELDMLPVADHALMDESRGMFNLTDQDNIIKQGGLAAGNNMINSVVITGANHIAAGALSGSNGIIMLNLSSGNNNITNMSTSVNITTVR
ncbi:hypothetical protein CBP31_09135 [Oceanisphaera profunda]|uniref:Carbon storage regulator n=1 Tax=Oceanisphaera profunda TaxID=1416627 RepID=A0A1Y0D5F0_9GAMM|nr:hypothetical protein [Oceanisphaera profunda]ART82768.1 hypothetical protein CBP31_09135 [Oceanisphaera profunda]